MPGGAVCGPAAGPQWLPPHCAGTRSALADRVAAVQKFEQTGALDPNANIQFGEGGAGTFSDGKLTTRVGDPLCGFVTDAF